MAKKRNYTADFYCVEQDNDAKTSYLIDLLTKHLGGHAPAYSIDDEAVKYQIRSIRANKTNKVFAAVFGKLRHDGTPEQATEDGQESDVALKPGHGLVDKNHFLFYADLNLIVFQRNNHAGRNSHLQAYLNRPTYSKVVLVPVLTQDSYARLLEGGNLKKLEISIRKPAFSLHQEDALLSDCVDMFKNSDAGRLKVVLSAERNGWLKESVKDAVVTLSKFSRTRVARATMVEDNEVIDLVMDRIVKKFEVELQENGRPDARSVFAGLATAKDECSADLKAFFNP